MDGRQDRSAARPGLAPAAGRALRVDARPEPDRLDLQPRRQLDAERSGRRARSSSSSRRRVVTALPGVTTFIVGNEPNSSVYWQPQFDACGRRRRGEVVRAAARGDLRRDQGGAADRDGDRRRARLARQRRHVALADDVHPRSRARLPRERPQGADHGRLRRARVRRHLGAAAEHAAHRLDDRRRRLRRSSSRSSARRSTGRRSAARRCRSSTANTASRPPSPPTRRTLYTGTENQKTVDEATQGRYYAEAFRLALCQPNVIGIMVFHVVDESALGAWQSGPFYADGTPKSSRARDPRRGARRARRERRDVPRPDAAVRRGLDDERRRRGRRLGRRRRRQGEPLRQRPARRT